MTTNKLPKLLLVAFFFAIFTDTSFATDLDQKLKTQLVEQEAAVKATKDKIAAKLVATKKAELKAAEKALAYGPGKPNAVVANKSKSETDQKQDAKIAALEAGVLDYKDLTGDVLKFKTRAFPFTTTDSDDGFCAPVDSKARVKKVDDDGKVYVDFKKVLEDKTGSCSGALVRKGVSYTIGMSKLDKSIYNRKGIVYGGLVVPFKYYMGGDKRISASSTIAPYVGIRGLGHFWGAHVTPIFSAGLGLVPVNKMTTGDDGMVSTSTETKSALSVATGLVLTHEKNKAFTAGILFGKDFLSNEDRLADPTVDKFWTSLYIGLTVGGKK